MELRELELPGLELVDPNTDYSGTQTIFIDFDGASNVSYDNDALGIYIDNITVAHSGLSAVEQTQIISDLNTTFADTGVFFTTGNTENTEVSTIYVGNAGSAFSEYGTLNGLAETIDAGNQIHNDEAFVFSDNISTTTIITETITHEAAHLIGYAHDDYSTVRLDITDFAAVPNLITFHTWKQHYGIYLSSGERSDITYNEYTPVDDGQHSVTGCVATATSQLLYYWGSMQKNNGLNITVQSIAFDNTDSYVSSWRNIDFDADATSKEFLSFSQLNIKLANIQYDFNAEEIAALSFGVGVKVAANYSKYSTSASLADSKDFLVDLGFSDAKYFYKADGLLNSSSFELHSEIVDDINQGMPVLLSLKDVDSGSGHVVIADGYDSSQDKFHINMGWGSYRDGWYSLNSLPSGYDIVQGIAYDIGVGPVVIEPATPDGLSVVTNQSQIMFDWNDSISINSSIKSYTIEYSLNSDFSSATSKSVTVSDLNVNSLADGIWYWRVKAIDNLNIESDWQSGFFNVSSDKAETKLYSADAAANSSFGWEVAIQNDHIFATGNSCGKTKVFNHTANGTWSEEATFSIGYTVSADANRAISPNGGIAYLYERTGHDWNKISQLTHQGSNGSIASDIDGDNVIINGTGGTYLYQYSGTDWTSLLIKASSDTVSRNSVAIDSDTIVYGNKYNDNANGTDAGYAAIFTLSGTSWSETALIATVTANSKFGSSVALNDNFVFIGAETDKIDNYSTGAVYIFNHNGNATAQEKITASDGASYDYFGSDIAVDDDYLVVGAMYDDDQGNNSGSAYVYHYNGSEWAEVVKLTASDGNADDYFGKSVAIENMTVVIGARGDDDLGDDAGAFYVYDLNQLLNITTTPIITVTATDASASEPNNNASYRISRGDSNTSSDLVVNFTMSGTAIQGSDYTIAGSVTIVAGAEYADLTLTVVDDDNYEADETAILTITADDNYELGDTTKATVTICDNDPNLWVSTNSLTFDNAEKSFTIENSGYGELNYQLAETLDWLSLDITNGSCNSETDTITATVDYTKLPAAMNNGTITVSSGGNSVIINITAEADSTPPTLPSQLTQIVNNATVEFHWNESTDDKSGVKEYIVEYANNSDFTDQISKTVTASEFISSPLPNNNFYWRVKTVDFLDNNSNWVLGDEFTIDYPDDISPTTPPWVGYSFYDGAIAVLRWNASTDDRAGIKEYIVEVADSADFINTTSYLVVADNRELEITDLVDGDQFFWRVKAVDYAGNESAWSDSKQVDAEPKLSVSDDYIYLGNSNTNTSFEISNGGVGQFSYSLAEDIEWLELSTTNGSVSNESDNVFITVNRNKLTAGYNSANITVTGAGETKNINIGVNNIDLLSQPFLEIGAPFRLSSTGERYLYIPQNGSSINFEVKNIDNGVLNYELVENSAWFTLSSTSGALSGGESDTITLTSSLTRHDPALSEYGYDYVAIKVNGITTKFDVKQYLFGAAIDFSDNEPPAPIENMTQSFYGDSVFLDWDDTLDDKGLRYYSVSLYSKTEGVNYSNHTTVTSSAACFSDLPDGSYRWTVYAPDRGPANHGSHAYSTFSIKTPDSVMPTNHNASSNFNGNGSSDILWQHQTAGIVGTWTDGSAADWNTFGAAPVATWTIVGIGDFDGDGHADILWHGNDGTVGSWNEGKSSEWQGRGAVPVSSWEVVEVGDFDGNGNSDILWQNKDDGLVGTWESGDAANWQARGSAPRSSWEITGVGDFSDDGQDDILWQNKVNGMVGVWNDGDAGQWQGLGTVSRDAWEIVGVGDFEGNGKDDILWQNKTTGLTGLWNNGDAGQWQALGSAPRADWEVAGIGDFNGNGTDDILWRGKTSTTVGIWESGSTWQQLGNASADWKIQIA